MPTAERIAMQATVYPVSLREQVAFVNSISRFREITRPRTKIAASGVGLKAFTVSASINTGAMSTRSKRQCTLDCSSFSNLMLLERSSVKRMNSKRPLA
jgi:hypothetical protein